MPVQGPLRFARGPPAQRPKARAMELIGGVLLSWRRGGGEGVGFVMGSSVADPDPEGS